MRSHGLKHAVHCITGLAKKKIQASHYFADAIEKPVLRSCQ